MATLSSTFVTRHIDAVAAGEYRLSKCAAKVLILIPLIWVLNFVDLFFTRLAFLDRDFVELNPLANHLSGSGQLLLKLLALLLFTCVCVALRRRRSVLIGCWAVFAVYGTLAVIWISMFNFLLKPVFLEQLVSKL